MISNTTSTLQAVWGTNKSSVWAAGGPTAIYYDGVKWQVRAPQAFSLTDVHGTTASNVFAIEHDGKLHKFNGSTWSYVLTVPGLTSACLFVDGDDSLWVGGRDNISGNGIVTALYRVQGTNVNLVGGTSTYMVATAGRCSLWAASPNDVWLSSGKTLHYDGSAVSEIDTASTAIWGLAPLPVFMAFQSLSRFDGTNTDVFPLGTTGTIFGLHGTAPNRVFAALATSSQGRVLFFDSLGWTQEPIPAGTNSLYDVYAAPSGEVYAVGDGGTVLVGP